MRKRTIICGLLCILSVAAGCSPERVSSTDSSYSSLSTSEEIISSISTNEEISSTNQSSNEGVLEIILQQDFYYNESHYIMKVGEKVIRDESHTFIGYFINEEDLEKWNLYDNNPSLVYVINVGNTLFRRSIGNEELKNRFELYTFEDSENIGVSIFSELLIYEKEGGC